MEQMGDHGRRGEDHEVMPRVRGKLTRDASLAPLTWFKTGGPADWLFEPADVDDLTRFLEEMDEGTPVMALGLGSNLIVRDGGVPGVVIRLGKAFAGVEVRRDCMLECRIDGKVVFRKTNVYLRDTGPYELQAAPYNVNTGLGVRRVWLNMYHGGVAVPPTRFPGFQIRRLKVARFA